ncbi:hypothetical protein DL96DRAFT_1688110 [Flagelloscypha sp. PMI_526]|nr:hypothetical protein DL96DRAFT_1688110 [Flagelloscypha sp. PMI_526]
MPLLVLDVFLHIFSHFAPSKSSVDRKALLTCCLLCHTLSPIALRILYSHIVITTPRALISILDGPHISRVRYLEIIDIPANERSTATIVRTLTNHSHTLRSIHLIGACWSDELWKSLEQLLATSSGVLSKMTLGLIFPSLQPRASYSDELANFELLYPDLWSCLTSLELNEGWKITKPASPPIGNIVPVLDTLVLGYTWRSGWKPSPFVDKTMIRALSFGNSVCSPEAIKIIRELAGNLEVLAISDPYFQWDMSRVNFIKLSTLILHFTRSSVEWMLDVQPFLINVAKISPTVKDIHISLYPHYPGSEFLQPLRTSLWNKRRGLPTIASALSNFCALKRLDMWFHEHTFMKASTRERHELEFYNTFRNFREEKGGNLEMHWDGSIYPILAKTSLMSPQIGGLIWCIVFDAFAKYFYFPSRPGFSKILLGFLPYLAIQLSKTVSDTGEQEGMELLGNL